MFAHRRQFDTPAPASLLPTSAHTKAASGTPAARLLFWNGAVLIGLGEHQHLRCNAAMVYHYSFDLRQKLAGALCCALPRAVESIHPHRKGEVGFQESIRSLGLVLMGVGALYSFVGGQNFQVKLVAQLHCSLCNTLGACESFCTGTSLCTTSDKAFCAACRNIFTRCCCTD